MCVFAVMLQTEGLTAREYFAKNGVTNLSKKIELFQFHFHNSSHLGFKLEDSDSEFAKLDTEQRNKVKYLDFVKKIEDIQRRIPNSEALLKSSRVLQEKNDSNLQSSRSKFSDSKRRINRKSKEDNFKKTSTKASFLFKTKMETITFQ